MKTAEKTTEKTTEWGVLHRIAQEASEHFFLRLRVTEAPSDVTRQTVKEALERAGRTYSEGPYLWGNHSIVPQEQWPDGVREDYTADAVDSLPYADLLDEAKGEKRVTLRLPIGLHGILVKAAGEKSFNQFCIEVLSAAVGYGEALPDYIPLLAQHNGQTEEQVRESVAQAQAHAVKLAAGSEKIAERQRKMQAYFQALGQLPPESVKQQARAMQTPDMIEQIIKSTETYLHMAPDQVEAHAAEMGMPADEVRAAVEKMRLSFGEDYKEKLRAVAAADIPAGVVKATYQRLADSFREAESPRGEADKGGGDTG